MASKPKYMNYSLQELITIIKNSCSFEQVLTTMNYVHPNDKRCISGIQKYLDKNNIDYSHFTAVSNDMIVCKECGLQKHISEYYTSNGKTHKVCKECVKQLQKQKYYAHQDWINTFKQEHPCVKCGCDKPYLIDFHHINPQEKDYAISERSTASIKTIIQELEKCISLCANCHREFHYLEKEYGITIDQYIK